MEAIAFVALIPVLAVLGFVGFLLWKIVAGVFWLLGRALRLSGRLIGRVAGLARATVVQALHAAGALATAAAVVPLTLANLLIGRVAAARHYGRAVRDELGSAGAGVYRLALGNPLRFLGLGFVLDRVERRLVDLVDRAPRAAGSRAARDAFPGYQVLGTLPSGGSGARLFLARPDPATALRLRALGREPGERVVIKSFALGEGSTLPQIVRESRALEAASRLGLVLEHDLRAERFHYVTRYVEGDELSLVGQRLHARAGPEGLGRRELGLVLGYAQDLLRTLHGFHQGGLWHKDVKPANVIVSADRAHLVDFGLVTPLASALTLTTHGTEYYRDPEMVRLALQGVKVHEVDGVKFDLYSAGAVLYSLLESSFPAQGSLSRFTKRVPDALEWIVRRSMADIQARYGSAAEMLADLRILAEADDPFAVRPADLPSYRGERPLEPVAAGLAAARASDPFVPPWPASSERGPRRATRTGRGRRLAVVAAVFAAILAARAHERRGERRAWREDALSEAVSVLERHPRLYAHERAGYERGLGILDAVREAQARAPSARRVASAQPADPSAPVAPAALPRIEGPRARVLLVLEGDEDEALARRLERELAGRGVELLALGRAAEDDADEVVRLTAGARHALGLARPEDGESDERLRVFLADEPALAGVVWVARPDDAGARLVRVVDGGTGAADGLYRLEPERALASR